MQVQRIHITGGPGSGKTTVAKRLSLALRAACYHLDEMVLDVGELGPDGIRSPFEVVAAELPTIVAQKTWVTEGAYLTWATLLFKHADLVIWMDVPWRVASFRLLVRHFKAEIARNNRFPGWRRLYRFWRWSSRYYKDRNPWGFQSEYGIANTRSVTAEWLKTYREKLVICRTKTDIETLLKRHLAAARR